LSQPEVERILSNTPLFSTLDQEKIRAVLALSEKRSFRSGECIVREGEIASDFFLILEGQVEVQRDSKPVARLGRGQFFGETTLAQDEARSADIIAMQPTICLRLTKAQLREVIEKNPLVAIKLLEEVTKRYRRAVKEAGAGKEGVGLEPERMFDFESETSRQIFESLVDSFINDYMIKKFVTEKCGWRTITEISRESGVPTSLLYGKQGKIGSALEEPVRRGLVEIRFFPGERGRGGEVMRSRIAYEKEPVKGYVNTTIRTGRKLSKKS
jgi:hypothetical protein